jgi:hypothetical protein
MMINFWFNILMLAAESQRVIWLRMMKVSRGGPAAERETKQMVSEKVVAATVAAGRVMTGSTPTAIVKGYRREVRANARRLSK